MDIEQVIHKIPKWVEQAHRWVTNELYSIEMLIQLVLLVALPLCGYLLSRLIRPKLLRMPLRWVGGPLMQRLIKRLTFPVIWLCLLGIALITLAQVGLPSRFLQSIANLLIAWIVIRFCTVFVSNSSLSKFISLTAWGIAALNILGWLDPTVTFLDSVAFNLGQLHVSVLTIIKGLVTLGALLWGAIAVSNVSERHLRNVSGLTPSLQVLLSKLLKIILITFAILIGVSSVGIDITALAVFSGAVGVGIGFGLQKIVSNFISGVILLLDRSIKPGDVIEVDDTYGWINKLSGRHVSVITRDGKEHLIPNEDLITQRVINWSYSDKTVRLRIPIGVSYKTDIHKARELILQAAHATERVIDMPEPVCLLMGFGDSSVDFELRVWIEDPSNGVANVKSEILLAVWDNFMEHAIEIPFPQRDVHLDLPDVAIDALKQAVKKKNSAAKKASEN